MAYYQSFLDEGEAIIASPSSATHKDPVEGVGGEIVTAAKLDENLSPSVTTSEVNLRYYSVAMLHERRYLRCIDVWYSVSFLFVTAVGCAVYIWYMACQIKQEGYKSGYIAIAIIAVLYLALLFFALCWIKKQVRMRQLFARELQRRHAARSECV